MNKFNEVQAAAKTALQANSFFSGVAILLEYDPAGNANLVSEQEARFEGALAAMGVVIVILTPFAEKVDESKDAGLSLAVTVPVVFVENPRINRGPPVTANPTATPPIAAVTPFGKVGTEMVEEGIRALLNGFKFPSLPVQRPQSDRDGLIYHHLLPMKRHVIRAL